MPLKKITTKNLIVLIILILSLSTILLWSTYCEYRIKKFGIVSSCCVFSYTTEGKGADFLNVEYVYDGKQYKGQKDIFNISHQKIKELNNKCFPIIFLKNDPKIYRVLIFEKDFRKYNINFPDSLLWVKQILSGNEY